MNDKIITFGTFDLKYGTQSNSVSYTAPSILPTHVMKRISFGEVGSGLAISNMEEEEDVSHGTFFGENLKRLKGLFS